MDSKKTENTQNNKTAEPKKRSKPKVIRHEKKFSHHDRLVTYRIGDGENIRFIEVEETSHLPSSYRASISFKNNEKKELFNISYVGSGMVRMTTELLAQLSWKKDKLQKDFLRCAYLIYNSNYPADVLHSMIAHIEYKKNYPEERQPYFGKRLGFDWKNNDCSLKITNEADERGITLCDDKNDDVFCVFSYLDEERAIEEIVSLSIGGFSSKEIYEKIKEKLSDIKGDPFADKLLLSMKQKEKREREKEEREKRELNNSKLAKIRLRLAKKLGIKTELPRAVKKLEKAVSDKLLGKVHE